MANVQGIGKRDESVQTREMGQPDEWNESPLFAPEYREDKLADIEKSDNVSPMRPKENLSGTFHGLFETKNADVKKRRWYGKFKDSEGTPFRIYMKSQLKGILSKRVELNQYVSITYNGFVMSEELETEVHDFKVEVATASTNTLN